jgi:hypothetical protein
MCDEELELERRKWLGRHVRVTLQIDVYTAIDKRALVTMVERDRPAMDYRHASPLMADGDDFWVMVEYRLNGWKRKVQYRISELSVADGDLDHTRGRDVPRFNHRVSR